METSDSKGGTPNKSGVGSTWQNLKELSEWPVFKKASDIVFGSQFLGYLSGAAAAIFCAANIYAKPQLLGVIFLVLGFLGLYWLRSKKKLRSIGTVVPVSMIVIGALFVLCHGWILRRELEMFSSFDIKHLQIGVGANLDQKTISMGTHGRIVEIAVESRDFAQSSSPKRELVVDASGLVPESDTIAQQKAIKQAAATIEKLLPPANKLTFFVGPPGSAKATILRQWVYSLLTGSDKHSFKHILLLRLEDVKAALASTNQPSLQELLATVYSSVVDSAQYYDLLLRNERCLVVITDWDKIPDPARQGLLKKISDMVANSDYQISVLIGTRPEPVLRDFSIDNENTFGFERYLRYLSLLPFDEHQWRSYLRRKELPMVPDANYATVDKMIAESTDKGRSSDVARNLATNLEFLNLMIEEADQLEMLDSYNLCRRLVNHVLQKDPLLQVDDIYAEALSRMHRLAYEASAAGTRDLEFSGRLSHKDLSYLRTSPVVDIRSGGFVFYPGIVHSYFALEGFRDTLRAVGKEPQEQLPLNKTLLEDVSRFAPLPSELIDVKAAIACSYQEFSSKYDKATKELLLQTLGNELADKLCQLKKAKADLVRAN
jgi:hypothetical protein